MPHVRVKIQISNTTGEIIIPAESVYAVFEAKQSANADHKQWERNDDSERKKPDSPGFSGKVPGY